MIKNNLNIKKLFELFNTDNLIKKLNTEVKYKKISGYEIIYTINDKVLSNSYIVSPYNLIINYGKEEIYKIGNKLVEAFYLLLVSILSKVLKITKIDKNIFLNNVLLSTNFYSAEWENLNSSDLSIIEKDIKNDYKNYALIFRSVNAHHNNNLYKILNDNWVKVASRQVYLLKDKNKVRKSQNYKVDVKLLKSEQYIFIDINKENDNEYKEAIELYNQLYLNKYSMENIQFDWKYLQQLDMNNMIHLKFVYDTKNKKNVGVLGIIGNDNIITAPIVGYDTQIDRKEAIYRRIIIYVIKYSLDNDLHLNLSSGASEFKRLRGLEPEIEYTFVDVKHLSFIRRSIWHILSFFSISFYKKMLIKLKL